jgi:hypothetical protein
VGVDFYGLKWGDQPPGPAIDRVFVTYAAAKPVMVAETAAADCPNYAAGDTMTKSQWIASLFAEMAPDVRPGVQAFFWSTRTRRRRRTGASPRATPPRRRAPIAPASAPRGTSHGPDGQGSINRQAERPCVAA